MQQLRRELRQGHLVPIAAMARSVVTITPELAVALRVPRPNANDAKVLASANAIAKIGDAHRDVLVQHGLPANFVDDLRAQAAALQTAADERRQAQSRRVGATKAIADELKTDRLVVQALDIVLTRALRAQPGLLAEWRNTKRVTVKPVHPAAAPEAAAASPAAERVPTFTRGGEAVTTMRQDFETTWKLLQSSWSSLECRCRPPQFTWSRLESTWQCGERGLFGLETTPRRMQITWSHGNIIRTRTQLLLRRMELWLLRSESVVSASCQWSQRPSTPLASMT